MFDLAYWFVKLMPTSSFNMCVLNIPSYKTQC